MEEVRYCLEWRGPVICEAGGRIGSRAGIASEGSLRLMKTVLSTSRRSSCAVLVMSTVAARSKTHWTEVSSAISLASS